MHLYSALWCIAVHPKRITIMWGGLLNHHQCAASTWMMRRLPQDNGASALTTHQLQVERRESHRANQVDALATHQLQVERRESHRANQVDALTTHRLQVERRESHRANQVYALTTHWLQVERRERVIEPIKCMHSPHTGYRWRGESHRANQVYALTTHQLQVERRASHRANQVYALTTHQLLDKGQWGEFGQDTGVTPLLFTIIAMGFLMTTESQDLSLKSHPKHCDFWQYSVPVTILGC